MRDVTDTSPTLDGSLGPLPEHEDLSDFGLGTTPTLTMLYHPRLDRIGERAWLVGLQDGKPEEISRLRPLFTHPGASETETRPLAEQFISRKPLTLRPTPDGGVEIDTRRCGSQVWADGLPLKGVRDFRRRDIKRGVILRFTPHIVLVLHLDNPEIERRNQDWFVGQSAVMELVRKDISRLVDLDQGVLIEGRTGTGKELVAQALHEGGPRRDGPFLTFNMAAIPPTTAASDLFGHVKGAFTGAAIDSDGFFRKASGGTLLLDEVGEMPLDVQAMLLRVLDKGEVQPVGAAKTVEVNVRVVAATDRDLEAGVLAGTFREALFHRFAAYRIVLPPLAERRDDIGLLTMHFLRRALDGLGRAHELSRVRIPPNDRPFIAAGVLERLALHPWPGNVRQLRNVVERLAIDNRANPHIIGGERLGRLLDNEARLGRGARPAESSEALPTPTVREDLTDEALIRALEQNGWRPLPTAKALGISRTTVYTRMNACPGIRKAVDLSLAEIDRACEENAGDIRRMAADLRVSDHGLKLRMKELGRDC